MLGSGRRRRISGAGGQRRARVAKRGYAVARLTRQPGRAHGLRSLAHYRVPPGHVGQQQTVHGGRRRRTGGVPVARLVAAAVTAVIVGGQQLVRRVQHRVLVVPREPRPRPSCANKRATVIRLRFFLYLFVPISSSWWIGDAADHCANVNERRYSSACQTRDEMSSRSQTTKKSVRKDRRNTERTGGNDKKPNRPFYA